MHLSTEISKAQHEVIQLTQLVSELQERKQFIFPDGTILVDKAALAAYILLKAAPKQVDIIAFQQALYGEVNQATSLSFQFLRRRIKRELERHLPEVEVVRTYDNKRFGLEVQGFTNNFDIDGALTSFTKETTVYGSISGTDLFPEIAEAFIVADALITEFRSERYVSLDDYSAEEKRAFLTVIAYTLNKPIYELTDRNMLQKYQLLGGKTLFGFLDKAYVEKSPNDSRTAILFLLESLGVSSPDETKRHPESKTLRQPSRRELELSKLRSNETEKDPYSKLEEEYQELEDSFDIPLEEENKGTLVYQAQPTQSTVESFPTKLQEQILGLGQEEQFIIYATTVMTWSFDIIAEEFEKRFKRQTDIDELQNYYQNALLTLKSNLQNENE